MLYLQVSKLSMHLSAGGVNSFNSQEDFAEGLLGNYVVQQCHRTLKPTQGVSQRFLVDRVMVKEKRSGYAMLSRWKCSRFVRVASSVALFNDFQFMLAVVQKNFRGVCGGCICIRHDRVDFVKQRSQR